MNRTIVAVLHDLNQAARYADRLVAMKDGRVVAVGPPEEVVTEELVGEVFELPVQVVGDPVTGTPMVVPTGSRASARSDDATRFGGALPDSPTRT